MLAGPYRPAQRPIWTVDLTSRAAIARAGITLVGAPAVTRAGLGLNGTTQYATVQSPAIRRSAVTIVAELTTSYDPADATKKFYIVDSVTPNALNLWRQFNGSLFCSYRGAQVGVSLVNYQAYWRVGKRNRLTGIIADGAQSLWLNGTLIGTATTSYSVTPAAGEIAIAASAAHLFPTEGILHRLDIFEGAWTAQEVADAFRKQVWSFASRASLWLDLKDAKRETEKDGGEKLADGNMEAVGVGAWTFTPLAGTKTDIVGPYGSITKVLDLALNAAVNSAYQSVTVAGTRYRIRGWARGDGSANPRVRDGNGASVIWLGTSSTDWQYFDITYLVTQPEIRFQGVGSVGDHVYFDDLSVTPTGQILDDGACEMAGVAEWTAAANAVLTKPTPGILRLAYGGTANPIAYQTVLASGRRYRVTGEARSDGTAIPRMNASTAVIWTGTSSTSWQPFDVMFTADNTTMRFYLDAALGAYVEWRKLDVRPVYDVTTDRSRYGRLVKLGDGVGTGVPAFLNPRFDFNGSSSRLLVQGSMFDSDAQSVVLAFVPDFTASSTLQRVFFDTVADGATRYVFYKSNTTGVLNVQFGNTTVLNAIPVATFAPHWKDGGLNVVVLACTSGANEFWLNGVLLFSSSTAWTRKAPMQVYVGGTGTVYDYDGRFDHISIHPYKLTPTQIRQITSDLMRGVAR